MKKVLIVDDYEDILDIISLVLQDDDIEIKCLTHTGEIFRHLEEWRPDLLLMDVNLGTSDGRDICKQMKDRPEWSHVKIILMSAMSEQWKDLECQADAKIDKPFDIDYLRKQVLMHLNLSETEPLTPLSA